MADREALVRGYAQALFAVAEAEDDLGSVEDQLFAFVKALEKNPKLRDALTDPALPAENKRGLVHDVFGDRASPHTVNILGFLIDQGRTRDLERIIEGLVEVAAERRRRKVAEVRAAAPLSNEQRRALESALSEATGLQIEAKVVIDASVIGGVVATVGDEVFDGTIRTRLERARERLGSG